MVHIQALIDNAKCYQTVRDLRWPNGTTCPHCHSPRVVSKGRDDTQKDRFLAIHQHLTGLGRRRYQCKTCQKRFDDLTNTIFAGHHQPLQTWILCLYFMGLNLSNQQIALELGLNKDDVQAMTTQLREGIIQAQPEVQLEGVIETDEVYIVAGHKGNPEAVKKKDVHHDADG
jgi:transposase-like protein